MDLNLLTSQDISHLLKKNHSKIINNPYPPGMLKDSPRPAAVLIPMLRDNDEWHLLFIRRTNVQGDMHSGQVAFPGGGKEDGDSSIQETALRETKEELGIAPKDVQILGELNKFMTITNFLVTPFVGVIPWPYDLKPSPEEVSKVFTIPINWLNDPKNRKINNQKLPNNQKMPVIYFNKYEDEVLWGASARFTVEFLKIILK